MYLSYILPGLWQASDRGFDLGCHNQLEFCLVFSLSVALYLTEISPFDQR